MGAVVPPGPVEQAEGTTAGRTRRIRTGHWGWDLAAVLAVVAIYLLAQWLLFAGPEVYDPTYYVKQGLQWPHTSANYWVVRSGLMVVVTVFDHLFGRSAATLFGIPIGATMILAASCYGIMRQLFGSRLVAVAGALVAVLNQDTLLNSAYLFPDPLSTAVFALAMFLLVLARRDGPLSPRWAMAVAGLSGFLFGYTYLIREFSPLLAPAVIFALFVMRYPWRRGAVVVGGAILAFCLELIYGAVEYHDPLIRLHILTALPPDPVERERQWAPLLAHVHNLGQSLLVFPRLLLSWRAGWIMLALLVILAVATAVLRRRGLILLSFWVASYWLALAIIGISHRPGQLPIVEVGNIRYWYPVLPAVAMGGIAGIAELARAYLPGPAWRSAGLVAVAAGLITIVPSTVEYAHCEVRGIGYMEPAQDWNALAGYLQSPTGQRIHALETDRYSSFTVPVYARSTFGGLKWRGATVVVNPRQRTPHPRGPNAELLIDSHALGRGGAFRLLKEWYPIWVSPNSFLAVLAPRPAAVPAGTTVDFPSPNPALTQRWVHHLGVRTFTPGRCGDSPYASKTS